MLNALLIHAILNLDVNSHLLLLKNVRNLAHKLLIALLGDFN